MITDQSKGSSAPFIEEHTITYGVRTPMSFIIKSLAGSRPRGGSSAIGISTLRASHPPVVIVTQYQSLDSPDHTLESVEERGRGCFQPVSHTARETTHPGV